MNFNIDTKERSTQIELMDDFSVEGNLLRESLDSLANINKWLGGNFVTLNGLKKVLKKYDKSKPITMLDLGCGNGDMLREVAKFGKKAGYKLTLIGIDANQHTIDYASELSVDYPEISYLKQDVFSDEFQNLQYDLVLATLFLHHFNEEDIVKLLAPILKKASLGIVVNDLNRNKIAYFLFGFLCLFIKNKMTKEDGLTSVLRAFKREDLERITQKLHAKSTIQWKWAFRYQWIIQK
ncbi:MAG: methyltransferase domain-containing protein [Lutibacter sp.]